MAKKKLPVLIINSYAGSLTLAAKQEGHPIIGSYEDGGYGLEVQKANFPNLDYRSTVAEWPAKQDLSGALVIAHPPCAAFSQQNNSPAKRGLDAPKFQQTKAVIEYALRNKAAALAVESVCGALEGAREVHDEFGVRFKYDVYRLIQNAVSFGVPQWRERCWFVFLPKGSTNLRLPDLPSVNGYTTVGDVLEKDPDLTDDVEHFAKLNYAFEVQRKKLMELLGRRDAMQVLHGNRGTGTLASVIRRALNIRDREVFDVAHEYCVAPNGSLTAKSLMTNYCRLLDERGLAPVILANSWWVVRGRNLSRVEWQRLMGFSDDYEFPEGRCRKELRAYLSRGVCPPVARWVLRTLQSTVTGAKTTRYARREDDTVVDLRPTRREVKEALRKKVIAA
jgi:site-specific DNA-cytosine methylase